MSTKQVIDLTGCEITDWRAPERTTICSIKIDQVTINNINYGGHVEIIRNNWGTVVNCERMYRYNSIFCGGMTDNAQRKLSDAVMAYVDPDNNYPPLTKDERRKQIIDSMFDAGINAITNDVRRTMREKKRQCGVTIDEIDICLEVAQRLAEWARNEICEETFLSGRITSQVSQDMR